MSSQAALQRLVQSTGSSVVRSGTVEIDFNQVDPEDIERHCATRRTDLPRGVLGNGIL